MCTCGHLRRWHRGGFCYWCADAGYCKCERYEEADQPETLFDF